MEEYEALPSDRARLSTSAGFSAPTFFSYGGGVTDRELRLPKKSTHPEVSFRPPLPNHKNKKEGPLTDRIAILTHTTKRLAKLWRREGGIANYDLAKNFQLRTVELRGIDELSELLTDLEKDPHSCIIRGRHKTGAVRVLRRLDEFEDQPLHTVLIEVDDFEPLTADPVHEPESAALEYIGACLPLEFRDVAFHWQLSNSAGFPGKEHLLKAHLWFWLATPATSASLREWARSNGIECDKAVFNPVQVHYTSGPVFEDGVMDPVPRRSGLWRGTESSVRLSIKPVVVTERKEKIRGLDLGLKDETVPFLDVLGVGRGGELHITCPFKDGHSMESGPSETVYFPKGTGGFDQGHFKCLHASCSHRQDEDYLDALGVRMADLEGMPTVVEGEPKDSKPLPPFERDKQGAILATAGNLERALQRSDVSGWQLRFDTFRDEIMMARHGSVREWRALSDVDYFTLKLRLESGGFKPIQKEMLRDAVEYVASCHAFDSAIEWLSGLDWDGVPRIDTFLSSYFSAADTPYVRAVSSYMWTALAGRVMEPGVKADMVPVLIGHQGAGKSFGLETMAPGEDFYTSIDLMARDADQARRMRGRLVIEIGELRGLHSRDMESIKDFITRRFESWIPKYREFSKSYPRRSVFIGTGNQVEFLADTTGNRRWLPVMCGKVDHARIKADRSQLWAEGRERFALTGVEWRRAQELSDGVHDTHRMTDSWAEQIEIWLHTADEADGVAPIDAPFLHMADVMRSALGLDNTGRRGDDQRVAHILRELGYERRVIREGVKTVKVWVRVLNEPA